jgi:TolB-like protein
MSKNPNLLSRFWQELKRRKVIYVITVYASAAFVIIELINNVVEPLNLPDRTPTFAIVILAIGFPIAVVLSWLFDLTPKGMERTKPLEETQEEERPVVKNRWQIATYISIAVIVGLIILNLVARPNILRAGDIQSMVVLPFENFTGDDQLENMVSGMHALLVGDMGRIGEMRVLGKTTSNAYKDVGMSATEIASEQNVDAVLETSVMCLGDSVCLQFRLVRTTGKEEQLWVADYKEDKSQILNLYNRITKKVADEIMIELSPEEERLLAKSRTVDREAYDAYLMGYSYIEDLSPESLFKARDYLNSAIDKDPEWTPLYAAMATVWLSIGTMGAESPEIAIPMVYENLNKANELNPDLVEIHYVSAFMAMMAEWDWEKTEKEFLQALAINPNHVLSRMHYSHLLYLLQRPEEAMAQANLAYKLDPLNPLIQNEYAWALLKDGDCMSALTILDTLIASDPHNFYAHNIILVTAFQCGDLNRVYETDKHILPLEKEDMDEIEKIYIENGFNAAYEEILRQLEILARKSYVGPADMAFRYYMIGEDEKAMKWIEKGAEVRDPSTTAMGTATYNCTRLYDNPRFIEVFKKMNLPLPSSN